MVVVTGIIAVAKVAWEVVKIAARTTPYVYKGVKKSKQGAQWLSRHPKIAKYGTVAASSAPIIYDLMNIDYSAIQTTKIRSPTVKQTRGNFQSSRTRQFCKPNYRSRNRY